MSEIYPPIHENRHFYLQVDDIHELYVEECGNEDGIPLVFLHGGPGAGCEPLHRQFYDPEKYRIILFDQRGCGRSHPHASIENNTTHHLIDDIEKIRKHLNIDRWAVAGGSWGATLALAYAQANPDKILGLILRGIFLSTAEEIRWYCQQGANLVFPDYWQDFIEPIPVSERDNLLHAYHKLLTGNNEIARMGAAKAWSLWEARIATLQPNKHVLNEFKDPVKALGVACIEVHYFMHHCFLEENQLIENMHKIEHLPGIIVHGRYDMICPFKQAFELHQKWNESELFLVNGAGHSASEKGISAALIKAGNDLYKQLSK